MKKHHQLLVALTLIFFGIGSSHASWIRGDQYTIEQFYAAIRAVEDIDPGLVTVEEMGKSVAGRPLLLVKIARKDQSKRAEVLITGNVHADEWAGGRLALSVAQRLASGAGTDPWIESLLDRMDFYIVPLMNPDGYAKADKHLNYGFTMARDNQDHVDLNRNWPYPADAKVNASGVLLGGSGFKWHPNYRGPHPLSEPEDRALDRLVASRRFFIAIDFHTTGGHFSYAWSYTGDPTPDRKAFQAMGIAFRAHQDLVKYQVHQSYDWYQIVGSSKDWFYGKYGVRALTVEVGVPNMFDKKALGLRAFNPFFQANPLDVGPWIENDCDAALYAIEQCYELTGGEPASPANGIEWVTE